MNVTVDAGSSISADGKGYGPNQGPGAFIDVNGYSNPGASYGGTSSGNPNSTYGSAVKPTDLGSGGAYYGVGRSGGGAMQIVVSDTFTNNGAVSSDGFPSSSGGSIYVIAKNFGGNGKFNANGGGLYASGYFKSPGGGGRVALYYHTSSFSGTIEAKGGCGSYDGWSMSCSENGTVGLFDESSNDLYLNSSWRFQKNDSPFSLNNIFVSNSAKITSEYDVSITAKKLSVDNNSVFTLADNQILKIPSITINGNSTLTLSGSETITANTLSVIGNSMITIIPEKILSLTISNITIDAGSSISADMKGHSADSGPGASAADNTGAGASYGGVGLLNSLTSTYGSETEPIDFGSGGATIAGGAVRIIVSGIFINDGVVSASGNASSSGGSVYITANNITGSGIVSSDGGSLYANGYFKGPGGGGRVALYYYTSSFTGTVKAKGGCGSYDGWSMVCAGDGTVHIVDE